ncbi:LysR substrate-binding domain-containing protein [Allorhizobium sp. BGMRC 0089]|uniref:LysR substrate-binding domain-containing protein n=1 Tax=Allorhizobium sonneratiae TaxID=2934936 RepID=UPI00203341EA|nr:LysR substrate-binding domain-containing protein [Allorhizobium sonneratiae]MCM2292682.1 LysR substrate-binding domain-containing protein [Allorhizobium sonneratiae]
MRFKNLDLNLLVALDTLIRVRNVSRAATEMFMTQSAMSNALGRLRDYFDDPLLIQVGRSMELSPLAASLREPLRDIIVRIEAAVVSTPSFVPEEAVRTIRLIVSDYTLVTTIPPFLRRVSAAAPGIHIDIRAQQNFPHLLLERGEADLLVAPRLFCSTQHPTELLLEDPLCCVVDADAPYRGETMTQKDFEAAGHIVMRPTNGGESYAQLVCRQAGLTLKVEVTSFSFVSLPLLVEGTNRIAILQRSLANRMVKLGNLRIIEPPLALAPLEQSLQWHSYRTRDPALVWLRNQFHASLKDQDKSDMQS